MEEFEVERIIDKKIGLDEKLYYKIKWRHYPLSEATWEPIDNCLGCAQAISDFEREEYYKSRLGQKRKRSIEEDPGCEDKDETEKEKGKDRPRPHFPPKQEPYPIYLIKRIRTVEEIHGILYANVVLCEESNPAITKRIRLTTKKLADIAPSKLIKFYESKINIK